jgi:hypothetical protein
MPRRESLLPPTARRPLADDAASKSLLPDADSQPRDWSEMGRRVLAEAQRRATDELIRRGAVPAPAASQLPSGVLRPARVSPPLAPEVSS